MLLRTNGMIVGVMLLAVFSVSVGTGASIAGDPQTSLDDSKANLTAEIDESRQNATANLTGPIESRTVKPAVQGTFNWAKWSAVEGMEFGHAHPMVSKAFSTVSPLLIIASLLFVLWQQLKRPQKT